MATGKIGLTVSNAKRAPEPLSYLAPGEFNNFSPAKLERREFGYLCGH
jgi:hypothetical protein